MRFDPGATASRRCSVSREAQAESVVSSFVAEASMPMQRLAAGDGVGLRRVVAKDSPGPEPAVRAKGGANYGR